MIGLISILFSKIMHMPVIVFNVPSLVPLVPGGPAYMAVRHMMNQEFTESMEKWLLYSSQLVQLQSALCSRM